MCILTPNNLYTYANIFNELYEISKHKILHSETIIAYILKQNNIKWNYINYTFQRIRISGSICSKDVNL